MWTLIGYAADYADLISGGLGIISALFLGLPLLWELGDRRKWKQLSRMYWASRAQSGVNAPDADQILRDQLLDDRLGHFESYRRYAGFGFVFLFLAFLFILIAALARGHQS
jgi:hypothetical protein